MPPHPNRLLRTSVLAAVVSFAGGDDFGPRRMFADEPKSEATAETTQADAPETFDWTPCRFGGDGPVEIATDPASSTDERLTTLGFGDPLTGIRVESDSAVAKISDSYLWTVRARRVDGYDFFAAMTFPIGDQHATFIAGGWGGGVTGVSSIDQMDASENETTQYRPIETGRWYELAVEVTPERLRCRIDDEWVVDVERRDRDFSLRAEMDVCRPWGIANYQGQTEIAWSRLERLP